MDIYMKKNGTWSIISMKDGGQLGIEKMPKLMIKFTITDNGSSPITYQAEDGMTWVEWCDSEYNTDGHYVEFKAVYYAYNNNYTLYYENRGQYVFATDVIEAGHTYDWSK